MTHDTSMLRARALVEAHISEYGFVPHPDKIKEAIATELRKLGLAQTPSRDAIMQLLAKRIPEVCRTFSDKPQPNAFAANIAHEILALLPPDAGEPK